MTYARKTSGNWKVEIPDLINEDADIMLTLFKLFRTGKYIFRGTSYANQCNPSITRCGKKYDVNLFKKEYDLIESFMRLASPHLIFDSAPLNLVASAQHYGVPTRFLDWTRDPFVALFFSINDFSKDVKREYTIYVAAENEQLVKDSTGIEGTWGWLGAGEDLVRRYKTFIEILEEKNSDDCYTFPENENSESGTALPGMFIYDPPYKNARQSAQKGLFQIPRGIENGEGGREIENNSIKIRLDIKRETQQMLMEQLDIMGYSGITLFPELDKVGKYVSEQALADLG